MRFEYECWKCDQWHTGEAETLAELKAIERALGVEVRRVDDAN